MAFGDLFNDGRIDVVINNLDSTPTLLRNVTKESNHWIAFKLVGGPKSPHDGVGASVYVTANGFRQRADVIAGGSFASSPDQRPHFGLGSATSLAKIEVHWPSGLTEEVPPPSAVDAFYVLTEGKGAARQQ